MSTFSPPIFWGVFHFFGEDTSKTFPKIEENENAALATLLDPRYKTAGFSSKPALMSAKTKLLMKVYAVITAEIGDEDEGSSASSSEQAEDEVTVAQPTKHDFN